MIITKGTTIYNELEEELTVQKYIGSGSFGDVYLISALINDEVFALKTIINPFSATAHKSFIHEGRSALEIEHRNVIKYYYFHDGEKYSSLPTYIIMEYADGGTLQNRIYGTTKQPEYFSNEELKVFYEDLINGMEAINLKLVHRDIKPDNILFKEGVLKITDFGLSKVVAEGTRTSSFKGFGCIQYLAPEGWNFDKNTIQMDIYSMGIVFYELACFQHPIKVVSNDIRDWENAHLYQTLAPISTINSGISTTLDQMISKMTEKKQSNRLNNWAEVREYLDRDNLPSPPDRALIDAALKKRQERVKAVEQKQLAQREKQEEEDRYIQLINYQFNDEIINPLKDFIDDFNTHAGEDILSSRVSSDGLSLFVSNSRTADVELMVKPILEQDFIRERVLDDYGSPIRVTRTETPEYKNRKVMAWGYVKGSDRRGFNILLVHNTDEDYGTWFTLVNKNNIIVANPRLPEPFPFELKEFEGEIQLLNSTHLYTTQQSTLDIAFLKEFISNYI